jgi:hypothetical protein
VDISAGDDQIFVEECQACSRPNTIHVHIDLDTRQIAVENEAEG